MENCFLPHVQSQMNQNCIQSEIHTESKEEYYYLPQGNNFIDLKSVKSSGLEHLANEIIIAFSQTVGKQELSMQKLFRYVNTGRRKGQQRRNILVLIWS